MRLHLRHLLQGIHDPLVREFFPEQEALVGCCGRGGVREGYSGEVVDVGLESVEVLEDEEEKESGEGEDARRKD